MPSSRKAPQRKRPLVDARGVEAYAGKVCSARRIERWREERRLPFPSFKDPAGRVWYNLDDIDEYLAALTAEYHGDAAEAVS